MKLWAFQFTEPYHRLQSARVAAPDRVAACCVMETALAEIGEAMTFLPRSKHPAEGVLLSYLGETEVEQGCLVSAIIRNGISIANEAAL